MKPSPQVLIVDGNPNDVQVVRATLESAGLSIHVRTDGISAIEAFHKIKPDVVLIDVQVPETDGVRVSRELKQTDLGRATPIILMSRKTLKSKERKHALNASGCALLLQKPVTSKQILETISKLLPNAFAPREEASDASSGEEAAAAPSPTTPFMSAASPQSTSHGEEAPLLDPDALNDEVLGALFDQVFPTSDAGDLASAIAAKTQTDPGLDKGSSIGAQPSGASGAPGARPLPRRPVFDASEDSLTSLLDEALPSDASLGVMAIEAAPSVDAEVVNPSSALTPASLVTKGLETGSGSKVLEGEVLATAITLTPTTPEAPASSKEPSRASADLLRAPVEEDASPSTPSADDWASPLPQVSEAEAEASTPTPNPYDPPPPPAEASVIPAASTPATPARADRHGRGKKSRGHRKDRSGEPSGAPISIPLSPAPTVSAPSAPENESVSFRSEEEEAVILPTPMARPASDETVTERKSAPRASRLLTILFFLLAAATILYILLRHQGEEDLRPGSRLSPAQGTQTEQTTL